MDGPDTWHASVAPLVTYLGEVACGRRAEQELRGLGDATAGQWREWSGTAFHLRRRLSAVEQAQVGDVLDVRGTPEARRRAAALGRRLSLLPPTVVASEVDG